MLTSSPLLYQAQAIKKLEDLAIEKYNISVDILMQRAGYAAFRVLQQRWPHARRILVVCGKGNNAGDGYVVAKYANDAGLQVKVLNLVSVAELKGAAYNAAQDCVASGVVIEPLQVVINPDLKCNINLQLDDNFDVIVDALLGTGLQGNLQQNYHDAICAVNDTGLPVLALDLPSGLLADSGTVLDVAVKAQVTVTFIGLKLGLVTASGREFCGDIIVDDLDLSQEVMGRAVASAEVLSFDKLYRKLPRRQHDTHKGNFGHVLVVGGDYGMGGAVRLAAEAAARVGAGLVSIVTRKEHLTAINTARPEIMCHGVTTQQEVVTLLERVTGVVIGPGLGKSPWSKMLFNAVLDYQHKIRVALPLVIDADGLNLLAELAKNSQWLQQRLKQNQGRCSWILTPHPGEAGRLLNISTAAVQHNRYQAVNDLQQKYGGVVILKGSGTLVVGGSLAGRQSEDPVQSCDDGSVSNKENSNSAVVVVPKLVGVCPYGNAGMASGGMGDVLSGVVGGLLVQQLNALDAARLAVCVHAKAGDMVAAADDNGGGRGMLALDLIPCIRKLLGPVSSVTMHQRV